MSDDAILLDGIRRDRGVGSALTASGAAQRNPALSLFIVVDTFHHEVAGSGTGAIHGSATESAAGHLFRHRTGDEVDEVIGVARFQRLLRLVPSGQEISWAATAAQLGYSDQSHLIAEFQEFAGLTPVPFFLSTSGGADVP